MSSYDSIFIFFLRLTELKYLKEIFFFDTFRLDLIEKNLF